MHLKKRHEIRSSADWLVWRGEASPSRELFLVKEVSPTSPYREQLRGRLREEVEFLSELDHPHLLRPIDPQAHGNPALFEDAQCSLTQYLSTEGPLGPDQVANILLQAASALEYLH